MGPPSADQMMRCPELFEALAEHSPTGVYVIRKGRFAYANARLAQMLGFTIEELFGVRQVADLVVPEDRERVAATIRERELTGAPVKDTAKCLHKDGTTVAVDIYGGSIVVGGERLIFGTMVDVSERVAARHAVSQRVRAERELDFERRKLAEILRQAPAAICVLRGPDHVIELANERTYELVGPRELVGRPIRDAVPELAAQGFLDLLDAVRASRAPFHGRAVPFEVRRPPDGKFERRFFDFVYQPILDPDGTVSEILIHGVDITDKIRLEEQLRQSQKMEAIGRLAGGVAHDFNNLLTVMTTCGTFLAEGLPPDSPLQQDVADIREAASRAAELTSQLLAFSRRQLLRPRLLDLNEVAHSVRPMLSRLIGEDIHVVFEAAPDLGLVRADRGQIEQLVLNLAVNARDAMPSGGTLTISTRNATWDDATAAKHDLPGGTYAIISVADTGVGMDEETLSCVFEPFFTTKESGRGTGLGLSMAYGIARQSGGTMLVESARGRGTTFALALPREANAASPLPPSDPRSASDERGTERILLVEDEPAVRTLVRRLLEGRGYRVVAAAHGREALEIARRERREGGRFDLLVTDLVMPELSGQELLAALEAEGLDPPVLYMSGYTNDEIVRRGLGQESVVFLQKPFSVNELTSAVRQVLSAACVRGR